MSRRNMLCTTQQTRDLQLGQGISYFHPRNYMLSGNMDPTFSPPGDTAEQSFMLRDFPDRVNFYGNHVNSFQNFHAVQDVGPNTIAPPNFYAPSMFPSAPGEDFSASQNSRSSEHLSTPIIMDELRGNNQIVDSVRVFGERKNAALLLGSQQNISGLNSSSAPSLSLNCESPQWQQAFEPAVNPTDPTNFDHAEYHGRSVQSVDGSHGRVRSFILQPESMHPYPNYALQAAHMGQPLHPATNVWMTQFASDNNIGDGACSSWNYHHPLVYQHGAFDPTNMGVHDFPGASSSVDAAVLFNPTALPNFQQHISPIQAMQLQGYTHQAQIHKPSHRHPVNNLQVVEVNPSVHGLNPGSRYPYFSPNAAWIFRHHHMRYTTPDISHGRIGIQSTEEGAAMDIAGFDRAVDVIDQHQDMRLDIDEMSYEELLALEERIGDVKTGLTEEFIQRNLNTSVHNPKTTSSVALPEISLEAEACTVCQVEYEKDEVIGTLDCGHSYHGECIKQWLLLKNLCPICKNTGLATANSDG